MPHIPLRLMYPELLLLVIPAWFLYRRWGQATGVTGVLRQVILGVIVFLLAGPSWDLGGQGMDVIVVVDRSRSMPDDSDPRIRELVVNLQKGRRHGDRVGVVTFGQLAAVEALPSQTGQLEGYSKVVVPDGSDLETGLQTALNLVDPYRPTRIYVLSDCEWNGAPLSPAIRRAQEMGVPIDFREFERLRTGDVGIQSVLLPDTISAREPFQFTAQIASDRDVEAEIVVERDGRKIAQLKRHLTLGMNQVPLRDVLESDGLHRFDVRVKVPEDPLTENNVGTGVVRVEGSPRVLVLNHDGQEDNLVRALKSGRVNVETHSARNHPLTQDSLEGYRAVVLENVPAGDLGRSKMERLAQYVEDLGGGLLLTGGERSFGVGGYFKSPLDETLPVSMEMREEHRKTSIAMAIALDRSGSMAVPAGGGKVKMDLANMGTVECIRMLSPFDSVAVIAVDSAPHIIQPLTPVEAPDSMISKVLKIQSMGGGIFVYEALVAAGKELEKASQATRHIILFSDAADSEEPGDYVNLLKQYEAVGITVSVIGLGNKTDVDAALLEDIAKKGKGNIMFTTDPQELPRLFTEDTMSVARSSFVKKDEKTQPQGISGKMLSDIRLMGNLQAGAFPKAGGYNLSYLKPQATMGAVSQDE